MGISLFGVIEDVYFNENCLLLIKFKKFVVVFCEKYFLFLGNLQYQRKEGDGLRVESLQDDVDINDCI